ncbi:uncharacterized protein BDZ99DRAFT_471954 [Mytilinidion resinicola]|uniref:Histone transcription regulator 3 homolog n=1 Tax=Mytilinidion resinicola TaxID=574789 RepID=A0A6A6Z1D9_9PEZI|nr:uncharacterized protein BDZ99DRAFT_471954 [Mytilinidion resinicola]KAF2814539.1 hypothetical protein BDZ99DRAFT_471954 [Mytilinidion resinicola]
MSAFKALNVESDNESEDEVDDTKEIQIEDALKLYQTALKYHSEGPPSYDKASEAYQVLFASEIFKYAESLSEFRRHELYGDKLEFDNILQDDFEAGPVQLPGASDGAPNTLPQILHLSYKNYGQFLLESMQHRLQQAHTEPGHSETDAVAIRRSTEGPLRYFAEALDKDDADLDLWSRISSVAALVGSSRITRFCLEAVLDGDDEGLESILRLPGLEEGFAGHELKELAEKLEDDLSLMQAPLSSMKRKKLSKLLKSRLNPYSFAPLPSEVSKLNSSEISGRTPKQYALSPAKRDWTAVGEVILHQHMAEQSGYEDLGPGSGIQISLPPDPAREHHTSQPGSAHAPLNIDHTAQSNPSTSGDDKPTDDMVQIEGANPADDFLVPDREGLKQRDVGATEDVTMAEVDADTTEKEKETEATAAPEISSAPSRKRSTDSADLPETADGGRVRSKRIRARESIVEGPGGDDAEMAKQAEDMLAAFHRSDDVTFGTWIKHLEKLGIAGLIPPKQLRALYIDSQPDTPIDSVDSTSKAVCDMFFVMKYSPSKTAAVLLSGETVDLGGMSREAGLNAFLGYAKSGGSLSCTKPFLGDEGLSQFADTVNSHWLSMKEVAFAWLETLLLPGSAAVAGVSGDVKESTYMHFRWTDDLKRHVVQVIVILDEYIYQRLQHQIFELNSEQLEHRTAGFSQDFEDKDTATLEMAQTLFELHLDIYSLIRHPNSGVDEGTQTIQKDRLERWALMARDVVTMRSTVRQAGDLDQLELRHIWASAFHISVCEDVPPEHILNCMDDLKRIFKSIGEPTIQIQNNAVMPELSVAAVDRELAKISMKGFFLKVFNHDEKDPVAVIESLEPILEPLDNMQLDVEPIANGNDRSQDDGSSNATFDEDSASHDVQVTNPLREMRKFLDTANVSLRLSLWQRLREAYEAIEYPPKVVSCYLRSVEVITKEFCSPTYQDAQTSDRYFLLLSSLRIIDELLIKILQLVKGDDTAFDCIDYEHLQTSMKAITQFLEIMTAANVYEDLVRVQHIPTPKYDGSQNALKYNAVLRKVHDMQMRAWILQYSLFKEGIVQNAGVFPTPDEDKYMFLRGVHYTTGLRGFCHAAGRTFLRLVKDEIVRFSDSTDGVFPDIDIELSQVLYDLYGLNTFTDPSQLIDFDSKPEVLERKTATQLLAFLMSQSRKMNTKDLPKSELKVAIDKVHGALGRPKANDDMAMNRKILNSFIKSPINPIDLFRCLEGVGTLSVKLITPGRAIAASKGWYYVMGSISLDKFRTQKRIAAGPTEDINIAAAFFMQDLEYSTDRWETWYRLAQAYDLQLEEAVSWTAEKLNSNSLEILNFQRHAIHAYTMAVACAVRDADSSPQTIAKVSQMYEDFGNRIYSSSREPFSMHAFNLRETEQKYFSVQTIFQGEPFSPMRPFSAWKLASVLFKRAIAGNPNKWLNHYMLGKCLWKMHCADVITRGNSKVPNYGEVVNAIVRAIDVLPKKDNRREPILEPHYKLVSIVYKLVHQKEIEPELGSEILENTSYAKNIPACTDLDEWEHYILQVLKALRSADKAGWHHRMTARAAHVIYDDSAEDYPVALGAKSEFTAQMFTKTMAVQVWKPENERPGRHFVYTTRYTRFFVRLLVQTGDRANLETLARRIRKKPHEFFEHAKLWGELCLAYLKLLRRMGKVPEGHEDAVFKSLNHDDFTARSTRLDQWCHANPTHPIVEVLREVIELKKLNNGLMKALLIDDLIGDAYALLYAQVGPNLEPPQPPVPQHQAPANMMNLSSLMNMQTDGSSDSKPTFHTHGMPPQQEQQAPRPRAKGVGRRELQKKAEAAVLRPPAPAVPMPIRSPPTSARTSLADLVTMGLVPGSGSGQSSDNTTPNLTVPVLPSNAPPENRLQVPLSAAASLKGEGLGAGGSAPVSVPGSVHDSADDESELSELAEEEGEEDEKAKGVFPNLAAKGKTVGDWSGGKSADVEETEV